MNPHLKAAGRKAIQPLLDKEKTELIGLLLNSLSIVAHLSPKAKDYIPGIYHERIDDMNALLKENGVDRDDAYHNFQRFGREAFYCCLECDGEWSDVEGAACRTPGCDGRYDYRVCWNDFA